ncbi:hypothetical protein EVAR_80081_1 [Eumeta japonica]|uniref:Lachesin n=1 Tax=Eumeta variegata TaxID=151549 RepID=A0A4C1UCY1_EUMVA|nr:hypothetical protein EVAR_80081_1 [Eumeta japonica]
MRQRLCLVRTPTDKGVEAHEPYRQIAAPVTVRLRDRLSENSIAVLTPAPTQYGTFLYYCTSLQSTTADSTRVGISDVTLYTSIDTQCSERVAHDSESTRFEFCSRVSLELFFISSLLKLFDLYLEEYAMPSSAAISTALGDEHTHSDHIPYDTAGNAVARDTIQREAKVVGWLRAEDQTVLSLHERAVLGARYSAALDPPRTWQLRIRPLRAEDRGCYMCQINTQPTMKWQIGCIDVYGRLYNVLSLHERAVLGARYSAALDPPRTWQLRIRPLRAEDRGCYMCQINTQPTMKWQIGCIDVYGRLYNVLSLHERAVLGSRYSAALDPPRTWQLRIRPLRAEDRGCYMCQINTQPTMKWQIGCIDVYGRLYNVLSLHERAVLGSRYSAALDPPRTWQLRIRPLRAEDRGCYMCQINTQPTMKWQIGCIDVYGRLYNVLSLHERAVLGSRYSAALDPPRTWQLRIRPLRAEDRGCYMCQINTQPTMKWQIGCIDVYGRLYNVLPLHERAVLGARYSAALDPPRTWQLRIRPLRAEDRGCYMCQINTQPTMKWQIGCIDVYGRLYNVLPLHERAVLGARYSAALDPPRTWQLRIRPLRAEDRGCYMCQINTQPTMKWQIGCIDVYGRLYNVLPLHERAVLARTLGRAGPAAHVAAAHPAAARRGPRLLHVPDQHAAHHEVADRLYRRLRARYSAALDPPRTWQLRIRPLRAEDRGCYMCQINTQPTMKWQIGCIDVYGRLYNVLSLHERALLGRAGPAAHVAAAHPAAARRGPRLLHVPDQHAAHHEVADRLYRRLR